MRITLIISIILVCFSVLMFSEGDGKKMVTVNIRPMFQNDYHFCSFLAQTKLTGGLEWRLTNRVIIDQFQEEHMNIEKVVALYTERFSKKIFNVGFNEHHLIIQDVILKSAPYNPLNKRYASFKIEEGESIDRIIAKMDFCNSLLKKDGYMFEIHYAKDEESSIYGKILVKAGRIKGKVLKDVSNRDILNYISKSAGNICWTLVDDDRGNCFSNDIQIKHQMYLGVTTYSNRQKRTAEELISMIVDPNLKKYPQYDVDFVYNSKEMMVEDCCEELMIRGKIILPQLINYINQNKDKLNLNDKPTKEFYHLANILTMIGDVEGHEYLLKIAKDVLSNNSSDIRFITIFISYLPSFNPDRNKPDMYLNFWKQFSDHKNKIIKRVAMINIKVIDLMIKNKKYQYVHEAESYVLNQIDKSE